MEKNNGGIAEKTDVSGKNKSCASASERQVNGICSATCLRHTAATVAETASTQLLKFAYLIILIAIASHIQSTYI